MPAKCVLQVSWMDASTTTATAGGDSGSDDSDNESATEVEQDNNKRGSEDATNRVDPQILPLLPSPTANSNEVRFLCW